MDRSIRQIKAKRGFTLLEMMAVVVIISIMTGVLLVALGNSRPSVQVKKDASQMVAFLRNMWDQSKASGSPLVLLPNYEDGGMRYRDPRLGREKKATFSSKAKVLAVVINDRVYNGDSRFESSDIDQAEANAVFISEGRGLTRIGVVLGVAKDETSYDFLVLASLNLINGRGDIVDLDEADYQDLLTRVSTEAPS